MKKKETVVKLFNEILLRYKEDTSKRGINIIGRCVYTTEEGEHCVIGQCMNKEGLKRFGFFVGTLNCIQDALGKIEFDTILKTKYHNIPYHMWQKLQYIHDADRHWDNKGLTRQGDAAIIKMFDSL